MTDNTLQAKNKRLPLGRRWAEEENEERDREDRILLGKGEESR